VPGPLDRAPSLERHIWKGFLAVNTLSRIFRKSVRQKSFHSAGRRFVALAPAGAPI